MHESLPGTVVPPNGVGISSVNYDEQNLLADVMDDHAGVGRGKRHEKGKGKVVYMCHFTSRGGTNCYFLNMCPFHTAISQAVDHDHLSDTSRELPPNDDQEHGQTVSMLADSAQVEDVSQEVGPVAAENGSTPKPKIRRPHRHPLVDKITELSKKELQQSREEIGRIYETGKDELRRKVRLE